MQPLVSIYCRNWERSETFQTSYRTLMRFWPLLTRLWHTFLDGQTNWLSWQSHCQYLPGISSLPWCKWAKDVASEGPEARQPAVLLKIQKQLQFLRQSWKGINIKIALKAQANLYPDCWDISTWRKTGQMVTMGASKSFEIELHLFSLKKSWQCRIQLQIVVFETMERDATRAVTFIHFRSPSSVNYPKVNLK